MHQRYHESCTATAERMPQRDRAAMHIELLLINLQFAHACQHLHGKSFVKFDHVYVFDAQYCSLQDLACGGNWTQAHIGPMTTGDRRGHNSRTGTQAQFLGTTSSHEYQSRCSVIDTRRVASRDATPFAEGWFQRSQLF